MDAIEIEKLVSKQREYFNTNSTISIKFRIEQLKNLYTCIKRHESDIEKALKAIFSEQDEHVKNKDIKE